MLEFFTVAGLAAFEVYAAIPAGFAFGMHPWLIFISTTIGGLAGVLIAAFLGDSIRKFFHRKRKPKEKNQNSLAYRLWEKYGIAGLGLLGTITVGAPMSLAVGVGLNAPVKKLVAYCCIGVLLRCAAFTTVGHYGMKLF